MRRCIRWVLLVVSWSLTVAFIMGSPILAFMAAVGPTINGMKTIWPGIVICFLIPGAVIAIFWGLTWLAFRPFQKAEGAP